MSAARCRTRRCSAPSRRLTGVVRLESVAKAIREEFPGKIGDANVAAATEAHDAVIARIKTAA